MKFKRKFNGKHNKNMKQQFPNFGIYFRTFNVSIFFYFITFTLHFTVGRIFDTFNHNLMSTIKVSCDCCFLSETE